MINITVPHSDREINFLVGVANKTQCKAIKSNSSDFYEISEWKKELKLVKKVFFRISTKGLSTNQVLLLNDIPDDLGVQFKYLDLGSVKLDHLQMTEDFDISTSRRIFHINNKGNIDKIAEKMTNNTITITEEFTYYRTDSESKSGIYIFSPLVHK